MPQPKHAKSATKPYDRQKAPAPPTTCTPGQGTPEQNRMTAICFFAAIERQYGNVPGCAQLALEVLDRFIEARAWVLDSPLFPAAAACSFVLAIKALYDPSVTHKRIIASFGRNRSPFVETIHSMLWTDLRRMEFAVLQAIDYDVRVMDFLKKAKS